MNQANQPGDMLNYEENKPVLSSGLNVLTILTIIWCVIQLLLSGWGYISAERSYETRDQVIEKMNSGSMPGWAKSMMGKPEDFITMVTKNYENRLPILLLSIVAVVLCFVGALQMRKLKKQGYLLYVAGEVLPIIATAIFIGGVAFGSMFSYIGIGIALLFILLYTTQRKNLIY